MPLLSRVEEFLTQFFGRVTSSWRELSASVSRGGLHQLRFPWVPASLLKASTSDSSGAERQGEHVFVLTLVALLLFAVLVVLVFGFGVGAAVVTNLVGFLYPAAKTVRVVEDLGYLDTDGDRAARKQDSPETSESEDSTGTGDDEDISESEAAATAERLRHLRFWTVYWMCFYGFSLFETCCGLNNILFIVPSYQFLKLGFLLWLFLPSSRGASLVYIHVLPVVDRVLTRGRSGAGKDSKSKVSGSGAHAASSHSVSARTAA